MNKIFTMIGMMLLCCGCIVPSINPFYTNDVLIQLPQLMGSWSLVSDGSQNYKPEVIRPWGVDKDTITTFDEHGRYGPFSYKVFKIDKDIFLDVIPSGDSSPEPDVNQFWYRSVFPVHLLLKLELKDQQLILTPLNTDWFQAKQKSGQLTLHMVKATGQDWGVFDATSQEWVDLLKKHKNEKDFFCDSAKVILKRIRTS